MEMKKLTLILFASLLALGSCSKEKKLNKGLEGKWKEDHGKYTITFEKQKKDWGKYTYSAFVSGQSWGESGIYTIKGDNLDCESHNLHIDNISGDELTLSRVGDSKLPEGHFTKQ